MDPIYVDWWMCDEIKKAYRKREVIDNLWHIKRRNRYIQFTTEYEKSNKRVHYEMCADGYLVLHFEGDFDPVIQSLSEHLCLMTHGDEDIEWTSWSNYSFGNCKYDHFIANEEQFMDAIRAFPAKMDKLISEYKQKFEAEIRDDDDDIKYDASAIRVLKEGDSSEESVSLVDNLSLADILHLDINIPDYQRIYCWEEKNVRRLLEDIMEFKGKYRMGAIILHRNDGVFNIVDGQQRLVTLSLILRKLGYKQSPLLKLSFGTEEARRYVAYNRSIVDEYIGRYVAAPRQLVHNLLHNLEFSALIINTSNIDLAYTFFSNENSRGKSLSDFDLLKAHHLRYVSEDAQAEHLAKNWDRMLAEANKQYNENLEKPYYRSLGLYVFRLRRWMLGETWDDFAPYKIKYEYEAAPTIDEIPPFGEKFYFNEAIQGGPHFFAFVKQFEYRFNEFAKTDEYIAIHKVSGRTHWWFRDVIETLLFGYYLKFGSEYLSEALVGISRIVLQYRYNFARADYSRLLKQASDSGIMSIIDRATSPTFVLADLQQKVKMLPMVQPNLKPIARELQKLMKAQLSAKSKDELGNSRPSILDEKIIINEFKRFI